MMQTYDIAIIGSGMASTATLIKLFEQLIEGKKHQNPILITVVEKYQEFWKGIPYGSRSSVNSLTITSIKDFFTDDREREQFLNWFKANEDHLIQEYKNLGGYTAQQWLQANGEAVQKEDWGNVYMPRYLVGQYMQERLEGLLKIVEEQHLVKLNLLTGEATSVVNNNSLYNVNIELADKTTIEIEAKKVVVAIGSAPERKLADLLNEDNAGFTYINNVYEPAINDNLIRIQDLLADIPATNQRNILVVGSNASCIELMYLINNKPELKNLVNNITLLSQSGELPYHITYQEAAEQPCVSLEELKITDTYTLDELIAAASKDIKPTPNGEICIPYVDRVVGMAISMLQTLGDDARKTFYGIHGMQLARLFRRSGPDYKQASDTLINEGKLKLLKGAFVNLQPQQDGAILTYHNSAAHQDEQYANPFRIIINCTGADYLTQSSSKLITSLIKHNNCKVNLSGKAFEVDEKFEAAPNLYIIGPLIGGNVNKLIHFWHLENASRLIYLAPYLAKELLNS